LSKQHTTVSCACACSSVRWAEQ